MKIAILCHDLEWTEKELARVFTDKYEQDVKIFDIRTVTIKEVKEFNPEIVLNRVYASVGNRDFSSLEKTIILLKLIENEGIPIINSSTPTMADYSKSYAFKLMRENNVRTPETEIYDLNSTIEEKIKKLGGFPIMVKRDSGGRAFELKKCDSLTEIKSAIKTIENSTDYRGKIILQKFVSPTEDKDYRIWVLGGKVIFYHRRSLLSIKEEEKPWLASRSLGSRIIPADGPLPKELEDLAISAAKSVKAELDVLDILNTSEGYVVIENNLTPNLRPEYEKLLEVNIIELLCEEIFSEKILEYIPQNQPHISNINKASS